jgi:hypothetical protein
MQKYRKLRRWNISFPVKDATEVLVWAPYYYVKCLERVYDLQSSFGRELVAYAFFLGKASVLYGVLGREGIQRYFALQEGRLLAVEQGVKDISSSALGLAVARQVAPMGWSVFKKSHSFAVEPFCSQSGNILPDSTLEMLVSMIRDLPCVRRLENRQ